MDVDTRKCRLGVVGASIGLRRRIGDASPINALVRGVLFSLCAFGCVLIAAPLALAAPVTFAQTGEGASQVNSPAGIAVDQSSGDVYVADGGNNRIDKFDATGNFRLAWGFGVADGHSAELQTCGPEATSPGAECFAGVVPIGEEAELGEAPGAVQPSYVAVDQASGDVYVTSRSRFAVQKFADDGELLMAFGKEVDKTTGADVCTASDLAAGDRCGGGVPGSGPGQIEARNPPLAVDSSGNVWVGDNGRLEEFSENGAFLGEVSIPGAEFTSERGSLTVDASGNLYEVDSTSTGVRKFSPGGVEIKTIDPTGASYQTIALDDSGNLFVGDRQVFTEPAVFREFDPAGEQISQFGTGEVFGTLGPLGIGIGNSAGSLYSASAEFTPGGTESAVQLFPLPGPGPLISGESARAILPTSATLKATLDPEGHETTYHFEYGTGPGYGRLGPDGTLPAGFVDETVEASLSGLIPGTTYHFRLVAEDDEGHVVDGSDETFTTLPAVQITNESVLEATATGVTFAADLDPLGAPAEWWVEYGADENYGQTTPADPLVSGFGAAPVSIRVDGLAPNATYHYQFAARDERDGTAFVVHGPDQTFTTQPFQASRSLLDGRAWEMVTPPAKAGYVPPLGASGEWQAAAAGNAFTYLTTPLGTEAPGSRSIDQVLARRALGPGWTSVDLALPEEEVVGANAGNLYPYRLFTPDLSAALVEPPLGAFGEALDQPLSPEASERTPYLRRQVSCEASIAACYMPVITGKPGFANVPPGTKFGDSVGFVGATPDLEHVVLTSRVQLSGEVAPEGGLYEWSPGSRTPRLVSVLPGGAAAPRAVLGFDQELARGAVSRDGSRVSFTSETHLYLRDTRLDETVQLDRPQGGPGTGVANAVFQAASADGTQVFFTDEQRLTADSGAGSNKPDLYVCEITVAQPGGTLGCVLTDLTPRSSTGEAAAVRGVVPGAAGEGSDVYYVADGALAPGAIAGGCIGGAAKPSPEERCNLYVSKKVSGGWRQPRLIAELTTEDANDWGGNGSLGSTGSKYLSFVTSRVSPNGRWLAFMSNQPLAGYDNRDAASGERDEEVYLYDAEGSNGAGILRCASCDPSWARPRGELIKPPSEAVDAQRLWPDRWVAANIPGWENSSGPNTLYQPRYLSDSGRLFFNSPDHLSPNDGNGNWDVYMFEPSGVGDCVESSAAFSPRNGGCIGLISSGGSGRQSSFIDAGESGDDVFFWTHAKLVAQDTDTAADIYDARVCTTASPCLSPAAAGPPCTEAPACRGPLAQPPAVPVAGTAVFSGPGNQPPHAHKKKHHRRKHKRHRRHKHRRHHQAGTSGGRER